MSSILTDTKQTLGLDYDYLAFDLDIITFINAAFSTLDQLGVGQEGGYFISDSDNQWTEFLCPPNQMNMVKTYVALKVRMMFDPPATSFAQEAMKQQISEFEWRLNLFREVALPDPDPDIPLDVILDGGGA